MHRTAFARSRLRAVRLLALGLLPLLAACEVHYTDDEVVGESGYVLFNAVGEYRETHGLADPVCVGCALLVEAADAAVGLDSLLTDVWLDVEPGDAAWVTPIGGGRAVVTPRRAGDLQLLAIRDGYVYDSVWLEAAEVAGLDLVDGVRTTRGRDRDGTFRVLWQDVPLHHELSLGANEELAFTVVPFDRHGRSLAGIVELGVFTEPLDALDVDVSLPATPGTLANRVSLRPYGLRGPIDVFVEDLPTGVYAVLLLDAIGPVPVD